VGNNLAEIRFWWPRRPQWAISALRRWW